MECDEGDLPVLDGQGSLALRSEAAGPSEASRRNPSLAEDSEDSNTVSSLQIELHAGLDDHAYIDTADCSPSAESEHDDSGMQLADDNNVPIVLTVQSLQDHAESSGEQLLGGASLDASDPLIEGSQLSYIGQVDDGTLRQVVLVDSSTLAISDSGETIALTSDLCTGPEEGSHAAKRVKLEEGGEQQYVLTLGSQGVQDDSSAAPSSPQALSGTKRRRASSSRVAQTKPAPPSAPAPKDGSKCKIEDACVSQAWFTTKDDKMALQSRGHQWKQGQWSRTEVNVLQRNIAAYCQERNIEDPADIIFNMSKDERKDFYRTVARGLDRPLFSVYRRVIRMYDQKNHLGKYSPEEVRALQQLRAKHGTDWATIGAMLGRSASSVKDRCRLMTTDCNSGKWLPEEEARLAKAVYDLSGASPGEEVTHGLSWANVAQRVATRSEKQCRTKWLNYLNWKQKGGMEWTRQDDLLLISKLSELEVTNDTEVDWTQLSKELHSARSPQWLRGKWWTMKRHVNGYQNLTLPEVLEELMSMGVLNLTQMHRFRRRPPTASGLLQLDGQQQNLKRDATLQNADAQVASANSVVLREGEATMEGLQMLQALSVEAQPQGTLLLAQPGALLGGSNEHIIVHMVPMDQCEEGGVGGQLEVVGHPDGHGSLAVMSPSLVADQQMVQVGPQVIINARAPQEAALQGFPLSLVEEGSMGDEGEASLADLEQPESSEYQVLASSESEMGTLEVPKIVAQHPGYGVSQALVLEESDGGELGGMTVVSLPSEMAAAAQDEAPAVTVFPAVSHASEGASEIDLMQKMSSLSDPMLATENTDLMCSSTDIETDKNVTVESEIESPA